jgi:23S rRNA (adenine2503-C2)-methyltransferase
VNDSDEEIDGIVRLLQGNYALMNMIPFNAVPDLPYARPSLEKAAAIARTLHQPGVLTKLRQSAGQDVDGGCGQLRARDVQRIQPVKMFISGVTSRVTQVAE